MNKIKKFVKSLLFDEINVFFYEKIVASLHCLTLSLGLVYIEEVRGVLSTWIMILAVIAMLGIYIRPYGRYWFKMEEKVLEK